MNIGSLIMGGFGPRDPTPTNGNSSIVGYTGTVDGKRSMLSIWMITFGFPIIFFLTRNSPLRASVLSISPVVWKIPAPP